jgi:hypothetical protein
MNPTTTYSPGRLQKAIGNIAGNHLGFKPGSDGGVKPLPETSAEIVEIKKIYPQRRSVDFCFLGSDTLHSASAMVDYWHREGTDDFQPPGNLKPDKDVSWPFTTPEKDNVDLLTQINLLSLIYPPFQALLPAIQQLIEAMGGQHNVIKLLRILASQNSLNLLALFKLVGLEAPNLKELTNLPDASLDATNKVKKVTSTLTEDVGKVKDLTSVPEVQIPKEALYGAVIPLKGDKTQGYLLLGFMKLN